MRGVDNIVRMRRAGFKPSVVWVEMEAVQQWTRVLTDRADKHVDIHLTPRDIASIDLADLRCLNGIAHILVNGPADATTEKVARACQRAGAKVVEAFFFDRSKPYEKQIVKGLRLTQNDEREVCPA